jgi:hypothetical protein
MEKVDIRRGACYNVIIRSANESGGAPAGGSEAVEKGAGALPVEIVDIRRAVCYNVIKDRE